MGDEMRWPTYKYDPEYGPYVDAPTVTKEPEWSIAKRCIAQEDGLDELRMDLAEKLGDAHRGWNDKMIAAKAVENFFLVLLTWKQKESER